LKENSIKIFSGNANKYLAQKVSEYIESEGAVDVMGKAEVFEFSNGETFAKLCESIRSKDVFVFQPISPSEMSKDCSDDNEYRTVNDNLMELLILMDACKRASAESVSCVIPYYGYSRTDKKDQSGTPITAKLVADMLESAGAKRIITFDLHSQQIQGFFNIPVDNLSATYLFVQHFYDGFGIEVIVSPDSGGVARARDLSKRINYARRKDPKCSDKEPTAIAFGDKRRTGNDDCVDLTHIVGDVKGKNVLICDDIVDTAGSLVKVAGALKKHGAKKVYAACVHGVLSGPALERIADSCLEKLYITDTIPLPKRVRDCEHLEVVSIAKLLAKAVYNISEEKSVNELFKIDI